MNISFIEKRIIVMALSYFVDEVDFPDSTLREEVAEAKELMQKFGRQK